MDNVVVNKDTAIDIHHIGHTLNQYDVSPDVPCE